MGTAFAHRGTKQHREDIVQGLVMFHSNKTEFLHRFIKIDETWVHHFTPVTKEYSKQWTERGEPAPKKTKTVPSAGKVMASVFWDACGIIFIDYLQTGRTINGKYYANLLQHSSDEMKKKRPYLAKKKGVVSSRQCTSSHIRHHDGQNQ